MRDLRSVALAATLAAAGCAGVRPHQAHRDVVDGLVRPVLEGRWATSVVVGLVGPDGSEVHGYGRTAAGARPDERTLYEIGSVTKTFTGLLLSIAVERGEVSLQQPVQELLPPGFAVLPGRSGAAITLEQLAVHTSGLPRNADDLGAWEEPYAGYDVERLRRLLGRTALQSEPGARYAYSNLGMGLLGHALSARAGEELPQLLRRRILEPLGMDDTVFTLSPEQARRFAQPHDGDLRPVPAWDLGALSGAGGLRSTARDLLRYVAAQTGLAPAPLAAAMARTHGQRFPLTPGEGVGLGWFLIDGRFAVHQGGTRGSESYVAFDPVTRTGVVVLADTCTGFEVAKRIGLAMLQTVSGGAAGALDLPPSIELPASKLDRYVAAYEVVDPGSGQPLTVNVERAGGSLTATLPGGRRVRLYLASETELYVRSGDQIWGTFRPGPHGELDVLQLRVPGQPELTATRVR